MTDSEEMYLQEVASNIQEAIDEGKACEPVRVPRFNRELFETMDKARKQMIESIEREDNCLKRWCTDCDSWHYSPREFDMCEHTRELEFDNLDL